MLTKEFIKKPPRERAGSRTANAFDFQKNWALCLLLDCHENRSDYLIILDYHEDIVLFDEETNAKTAEFFQVKTNTNYSDWTVKKITNKNKGEMTIIGKLYDNKMKFDLYTKSLNFVSNAKYKFELANNSIKSTDKDIICVEELDKDSIQTLITAIRQDHNLTNDPDFEKITFFKVTDLPITGHDTYTKGKLADFLDRLLPNKKCNPIPLYKTLFSEISRKTDFTRSVSEQKGNLEEKAIGKKYFDKILNGISVKVDFTVAWTRIEQRLNSEDWNVVSIQKVRKNWEQIEIELLDPENIAVKKIFDFFKSYITILIEKNPDISLTQLLEDTISQHSSEYLTKDYLRALALAAFYEN